MHDLANILPDILTLLEEQKGTPGRIIGNPTPVSGGSINRCYKLNTSLGLYFLKLNHADAYPYMFQREAEGLSALKAAAAINIPEVIGHGTSGLNQFLLLEYMERGALMDSFWNNFGKQMARLHQNNADSFGWDTRNFIGSLGQQNHREKTWPEFFILHRLEPLLEIAISAKKLNASHRKSVEQLYKRLEDFFPEEKPSLLHGDFWNGNFMTGPQGDPVLFDPAVYYGHREMDLAMSTLFGGFDAEFYRGYKEEYPLEKGWKNRAALANLYPLLVHVNLFGNGYVPEVKTVLKKFS